MIGNEAPNKTKKYKMIGKEASLNQLSFVESCCMISFAWLMINFHYTNLFIHSTCLEPVLKMALFPNCFVRSTQPQKYAGVDNQFDALNPNREKLHSQCSM